MHHITIVSRPSPALFTVADNRRRMSIKALRLLALPFLVASTASASGLLALSPVLAKSELVSQAAAGEQISVVLALPLRDSKGAADFVKHVSTPLDPLYRRYLRPAQFAGRFGASEQDYAALKQWASSNGLTIAHESISRTVLTVRGTVDKIQALFKTELSHYRSFDGNEFISASVEPTVPDAITGKISGVIGLTVSRQYAPHVKIYRKFGELAEADIDAGAPGPDAAGGSGPGGSYSASDLRTAYSIPAYNNVNSQTVAIFEQGGYTDSDVDNYLKKNKLPNRKVTLVGVNGYNGAIDNLGVELEAVLDIDMVIGINPAVKEVLVYEDGIDPFPVALLDSITQVADDAKAQILSISYGEDEFLEGNDSIAAEANIFTQLAAEGINVLVSAGDNGAYGDFSFHDGTLLNVSDPASQPNVTSVGGTTLYTAPGAIYGSEEVWNLLAMNLGATGGGVSTYWQIPSYQQPDYVANNGGSPTYRNVPDVAAVGNPETGVAVYSKVNGGWIQVGGTSVGAPIWAGYLSIINGALNYIGEAQLGFFNPTLYSLGFGDPTNYLYEVADGSNGNEGIYGFPGFSAGIGYDNCTGAGSLWGTGLAFQLLTSVTRAGTPPSALTGLAAKAVTTGSAKIVWDASTGATGYVVNLFHQPTGYQWNISQSYLTKKTEITVKGLVPNTQYFVYVGAVNPSGSSQANISLNTAP
jgi:subtilase family serine protease